MKAAGHLAARARECAAELVGTFALVFIGPGACIAHHGNPDVTHVGVALAFGGVVACAVFAFARVSGAHINPAVTLALAATGRFPLRRAAPYVLAQCAGALAASAAHWWVFGPAAAAAGYGATTLAGITTSGAFGLETILTFILMLVVMAAVTDARVPAGIAGLAVGSAVMVDCLAAGKCCGASMNPARSLAPALFAGGQALSTLWIYVAAPVMGAVLAAALYGRLLTESGAAAAEPQPD